MRNRICISIVILSLMHCHFAGAHDTGDHDKHHTEHGERTFQVLKALPLSADTYQGAAADLVRNGIPEKYGHEEWAAVVIAHELHSHVGIMTVIGAKMAVRAKELLHAPARAISVVAETGPEPPFACAIDGIQAGLGSTYAQKLIEAPNVEKPLLAAVFEYRGRKIRLSILPQYQEQISRCIKAAIKAHGNLTPEYFNEIETFSYYVWATFDRREIFIEEDLSVLP